MWNEIVKYVLIGFAFGIGFTIAGGFLNWLGGLIAGSRKPEPRA
jgi:hypothetical protein